MNSNNYWIGVDYGSKLAGTTAVCYIKNDQLVIQQSEKKSDADLWLSNIFNELGPNDIFIDAPLSLPLVYSSGGDDFFYRECDKATKAMSPMFLGGLTARAMRLKANHSQFQFYETYPGYLVRHVYKLKEKYLKKKAYTNAIELELLKTFKLSLQKPIENWHQLDALACWISGLRKEKGNCLELGQQSEGIIIV